MNKDTKFSIHDRRKSFQYAFQGILFFFKTEHNAWLHLLATVTITIVAWVAGVTNTEAIVLIIVVGFVWVTEMLNTCIEKAMNMISEEYDPRIKIIKDISAGAVLVAAIVALLTGLIVFVPKLMYV